MNSWQSSYSQQQNTWDLLRTLSNERLDENWFFRSRSNFANYMLCTCNWPTLSIIQASTLIICSCMTSSQYFELNIISTFWLKNTSDIDFQTSYSFKTTIASSVFATLSHGERTANWDVAWDEYRARGDRERERIDPGWEEALHGDLDGNRPQIIRLKPVQSAIEIDPLSMWHMDISDEMLIARTFTFFETNDIAISSVNFEARLILFLSVMLFSNDPELLFFRVNILFFQPALKFFHLFSLLIFVHRFLRSFLTETGSTMVNAWQELDICRSK